MLPIDIKIKTDMIIKKINDEVEEYKQIKN